MKLVPEFQQDQQDPVGTIEAVRTLVSEFPGYHWESILDETNCCCPMVKTLPQAMLDKHFHGRGLFDHTLPHPRSQSHLSFAVIPEWRRQRPELGRTMMSCSIRSRVCQVCESHQRGFGFVSIPNCCRANYNGVLGVCSCVVCFQISMLCGKLKRDPEQMVGSVCDEAKFNLFVAPGVNRIWCIR